jgi:Ca2+-binding RTX toxin-like protein
MDLPSLLFKGNDTITIFSDEGVSQVSGFGGNDRITSAAGSDALFGGTGNDTLIGGEGNDWLYGEKGKDILTGGAGSDYFGFDRFTKIASSNSDTITDFQPGIDMLVFDVTTGSVFEDVGGDSIFVAVNGVNRAKNGENFIYDTKNGNLFFDADGAGIGTKPVLVATLTGVPSISEDDIYFGVYGALP